MIGRSQITTVLQKIFHETPALSIGPEDRIVIFSDLHLGNGSSRDDFLPNSAFFATLLTAYYRKERYKLILNGDIEELQRFPRRDILRRWEEIYRIFAEFQSDDAFFQITGNHDWELPGTAGPDNLYPALKLDFNSNILFILHGHQASFFVERFHSLCGFILKYIANPIGIKNYSVSHDSAVRFKTEQRVYNFSRDQKIVSIIGHTHRPLFESLSKVDSLKFKIEQLCRDYPVASEPEQAVLGRKIQQYQSELNCYRKRRSSANRSSLYNSDPLVPCIFNSGCVIGKNGITAIEIAEGKIALVYWFDSNKSRKYFNYNGYRPEQLGETDYYRVVLNRDDLDYIFTRIKLLA
jgi:predicted phosphodiesterase